MSNRFWRPCAALAVASLLGGCVMLDIAKVPEQQRKADSLCRIGGTVRGESAAKPPLVVVLVRLTGNDAKARSAWSIADHFVLEEAGHWQFLASPGTYGVVAFEDTNSNLKYESGEPYLQLDPGKLVECKTGDRHEDVALAIPADGQPREAGDIDVTALQARSTDDQLRTSLGEVTAVGEIASIDDPRFTDEVGVIGLWRPFDFLFEYRPGIYLLEPYDPKKIPVLFVHGITGHPANFRTIVGRMDRSRYQPFLYFYPSGAHLDVVADHLAQTMMKLEARHGFRKFYVVAHSMGGLTARGFLIRHKALAPRVEVPLFVTFSTPWSGHKGASYGVEMSPAVVRVWYDMAPGSDYLTSLFFADAEQRVPRRLGPTTAHHLLFSIRSSGTLNIGEANDDTVTVSSQLRQEAQHDAVRLYGFDETHMSILEAREPWAVLERLLDNPGGK